MSDTKEVRPAVERELAHHEELYARSADHFFKPAVVEFREHLIKRILKVTGAGSETGVLSLGCGIGDTELMLAPHVKRIMGVDLSPAGISFARKSAAEKNISNVEFHMGLVEEMEFERESFDLVLAIFFLHHLPDRRAAAARIYRLLKPGGIFYALDPSRYRLSGFIGKILIPSLMKKYQSEDEEQLRPRETWNDFRQESFEVRESYYDFVSTPLAGLFPSWRAGYLVSRAVDEVLIRTPGLRLLSSNFEVLARRG